MCWELNSEVLIENLGMKRDNKEAFPLETFRCTFLFNYNLFQLETNLKIEIWNLKFKTNFKTQLNYLSWWMLFTE